jgi:hypothetical protein
MKHWQHIFFPPKPRTFPGERWVDIVLRSLHLVGIAGISGGFLFAVPKEQYLPFWHLALSAGGLLILLYVWTNGRWLLQVKGMTIIFKLCLLLLASLFPEWRAQLFVLMIVISGLVAHAPGKVRAYSPFARFTPNTEKPGIQAQ